MPTAMPPVIENPILNGPCDVPARHVAFNEQGITDQTVDGRRQAARAT